MTKQGVTTCKVQLLHDKMGGNDLQVKLSNDKTGENGIKARIANPRQQVKLINIIVTLLPFR